MDKKGDVHTALTVPVWLLVQILHAHHNLLMSLPDVDKEDEAGSIGEIFKTLRQPLQDPLHTIESGLHAFWFSTPSFLLNDDLGYWVKPRSTTWFSIFLLSEYDDTRWVKMFRIPQRTIFALADMLAPQVCKEDTKYRLANLVIICFACTLFKLTHEVSYVICSEMFAIGKSTVCVVIQNVMPAINVALRHHISWPTGDRLRVTQQKFSNLCRLLGLVGAINGTHVFIAKPQHVHADYYYFKSGGYTLNCQAVVDSKKRFLDLYLGMPGSTNDSRVLWRSSLYNMAMHGNFFNNHVATKGFSFYLLGDQSYPLLPWLMILHHANAHLSMADVLFNKRLKKGRCVVENAFGIPKQTFRELLTKSDLDVAFLPDVILCYALLHNMLLGQSEEEVQNLLGVFHTEGLDSQVVDDIGGDAVGAYGNARSLGFLEMAGTVATAEKRRLIGVHFMERPQLP